MTKLSIYTLKILRKLYAQVLIFKPKEKPEFDQNPDSASQIIYETLKSDKPVMIARFGANELTILINYLSIKSGSRSVIKYIRGEQFDWWWNVVIIKQMHEVAGFFPPEISMIEKFCELMLKDIPQVDILGSWLSDEAKVSNILHAKKVHLRHLEPFWSEMPWSRILQGKKVLIVHPFSHTIEKQYKKRKLLFGRDILPEFEIKTLKTVQSLAREKTPFADWFEALEFMKSEIDKIDYDICLIGAGAYGFHLAAHVKRMGKKGFHLGGALQLLFGIRGKRWEVPNYGVKEWGIPKGSYISLINEHWVRPSENEKPKNADVVEGACYW